MASLICCRAQEESNRKPLNNRIISCPQDFRHISHYGDLDGQNAVLPENMSSKCGAGVFTGNFHLECIDLKERNGVVLGDISNNDKPYDSVIKSNTINNKPRFVPPKYPPPPPPPTVTQH